MGNFKIVLLVLCFHAACVASRYTGWGGGVDDGSRPDKYDEDEKVEDFHEDEDDIGLGKGYDDDPRIAKRSSDPRYPTYGRHAWIGESENPFERGHDGWAGQVGDNHGYGNGVDDGARIEDDPQDYYPDMGNHHANPPESKKRHVQKHYQAAYELTTAKQDGPTEAPTTTEKADDHASTTVANPTPTPPATVTSTPSTPSVEVNTLSPDDTELVKSLLSNVKEEDLASYLVGTANATDIINSTGDDETKVKSKFTVVNVKKGGKSAKNGVQFLTRDLDEEEELLGLAVELTLDVLEDGSVKEEPSNQEIQVVCNTVDAEKSDTPKYNANCDLLLSHHVIRHHFGDQVAWGVLFHMNNVQDESMQQYVVRYTRTQYDNHTPEQVRFVVITRQAGKTPFIDLEGLEAGYYSFQICATTSTFNPSFSGIEGEFSWAENAPAYHVDLEYSPAGAKKEEQEINDDGDGSNGEDY